MSLGTTGLDNFNPKRSGTATSIISALPSGKQKKSTPLQLRINEDVYLLFQELCKANNTDVSKALRAYINEAISRGTL